MHIIAIVLFLKETVSTALPSSRTRDITRILTNGGGDPVRIEPFEATPHATGRRAAVQHVDWGSAGHFGQSTAAILPDTMGVCGRPYLFKFFGDLVVIFGYSDDGRSESGLPGL